MEKVIALYDSDYLYATRFMDYINKQKDLACKVSVFTKSKSLSDYIGTHAVDILILGEEIPSDEVSWIGIKYIYLLSDDPKDSTETGIIQILKYQSVRAIMSSILSDYRNRERSSNPSCDSNDIRLISIFPPIAGSEKLFFAWALSSMLSEQNKVLFIVLDPFRLPLIPSHNNNPNLTEFIYYLKENSNLSKMNTLMIQYGNLHILSGILHGTDILSLSSEDVARWISELKITSVYNKVVFYLGCYTEAMLEIMNLSDKILGIGLNNSQDLAFLKEWENQMNQSIKGCIQEKIKAVTLENEVFSTHIPFDLQEIKNSAIWKETLANLNL